MNQKPTNKPTNKNNKKKYALPEGSLPVRPKSFFNFLPKQQPLIDTGYDSDSDKTVIIDEAYGPEETSDILNMKITDMISTPTNDKIYSSPPGTELLTSDGRRMFYKINDKMEAVTNDNYNRDNPVYDENGNEIPRGEHLPEKRIFMNDIMDESTGGKKKRKTHRKTHRKTIRKTKRKKTRRHRRRNTKKYK
jgi:hypothetical protein